MSRKPECPSSSALENLVQGRMIEPQLSELSNHLETCPACQAKARTLSGSDTMVESLRGEAAESNRIAQEVPRPLVERLKQIPRREALGGPEATSELTQACACSAEEQGFDFLAPAQGADEIGRLGHYRILKVLGSGGMGAVFLADDPKLERQVALKVMLPKVASNPAARDRFLREARAQALVKSDHIVTIHQVDEADGVPYLAMELLEGQSLDEALRAGGPLSVPQIVSIGRDVARGLAAAHEKGLIHRDIKPGNLWIEGEPSRVKILDFGLARVEKEEVQITQSGIILGTPAFMAPEQACGDQHVDARADLFSLGCVLYRLCAGDIPFKAETTMGTLMALAMTDPVPPIQLNASLPPALSELIMQLLHKDPARRPQSAREVLARLAEVERSPSGDVAPAPARPARKRRSLVLACVGLLLVGLVVAGSVFFWQTPDGKVVRIECDDPAIKIAFGDGELRVTGAYKEPLTLKPGKVGVRIKKGDDFEFETDKFIVNKGEKIVLRIEIAEGKVQIVQAGKGVLDEKRLPTRPAPPAVADTDRQTAEWVMTRRKGAVLVLVDGKDVRVAEGQILPAAPFRLLAAEVIDPGVSDDDLLRFAGLSELTGLTLHSCPITDAGLAKLRDLPKLSSLNLDRTKVTDAGLAALQGLPGLRELVLSENPLTDDGLKHLHAHAGLERVVLRQTKVTKAGLDAFHAAVPGCKIQHDGGTIEAVDVDRKAAEWVLSQGGAVRVNGRVLDITAAPDLPKGPIRLQHVDFSGKPETGDDALARLADCRNLTGLNLRKTLVTDAGLAHLKRHKGLLSLNLRDTKVTDTGLIHLEDKKRLLSLDLQGTKVTDAGLAALEKMPQLQFVHLVDCGKLTPGAVERFAAAVPGCRIMWAPSGAVKWIVPRSVPGAGTDPRQQAEVARWLVENKKLVLTPGDVNRNIPGSMVIEKDGKTFPAVKLPDGPFRVKGLSFHPSLHGGKLDEADIPRLAAFTDLEELRLISFATDAGLESLLPLQNLRRLEVHQGKTTPVGARTIRQFPKLEHLACPCNADWLKALGGMPSLRSLQFHMQPLTPEIVGVFEQFPNLTELRFSDCDPQRHLAGEVPRRLAGLRSLRFMTFERGGTTTAEQHREWAEHARKLAEALPACAIRVQSNHGKSAFNEGKASDLPPGDR